MDLAEALSTVVGTGWPPAVNNNYVVSFIPTCYSRITTATNLILLETVNRDVPYIVEENWRGLARSTDCYSPTIKGDTYTKCDYLYIIMVQTIQ